MLYLALPQHFYVSYAGLLYMAALFCLSPLPHYWRLLTLFASLFVLVDDLSSCLLVPSPASPSPLRHLPCPPLASSILLRLIAVQNGFVLVQQHPQERFPRSITLLFRNSYRLHRFNIPRLLIRGFRPSDEIDRLHFPSFARRNSYDNLQKTCALLCRSFITSLYQGLLSRFLRGISSRSG